MIQEIELGKLKIHPKNVRKTYRGIDELAESIKAKGILQNLTVVPDPDEEGTYFAVIGNRRLTAARKAGIKTAPCFVTEMSEKEQASAMLMENMQRDDLTICEQAQGFQLVLDLGETEEGLAEKTGFSKTTIRRRLNIAKLDQEALQEKEAEGEFQLSLSDLYELEKIKSVKKRNQILKDARNSREIASSVRRIISEERQKATEKKVIALLEKAGITEAPERAKNEIYTSKWDTVKTYSLRDEAPKKIDVQPYGKENLYYLQYWSEVRVIRKAKRQKRELTPEEKQRAERDSRKKRVKAMAKEMAACRRDFILDIISGKIKPLRDAGDATRKLWDVMRKGSSYVSDSSISSFLIGKSSYDFSEEEKKDAAKRIENLSVPELTLITAYNGTESLELSEWTGDFNKRTAGILKEFYEVLMMYGFTYNSDDEVKLLNGTHELYTEAEIN